MHPAILMRRHLLASAPLLLAGCSPAGLVNALAPDHQVARSVAYGSGPRRSLDVYAPSGSAISGRPVVLFLYGGSWDSGDKAMYRFVGDALASRGFVVVIPDYRLYPEVRYPAFLQDCAAALAWTRQHAARYGGSAAPPFIMGHSAGAYNAAMLTLDTRWLAAHDMTPRGDLRGMVGLAGPYDFLPLDTDELRDIFAPGRPLQSTQPITYVDGRNPPVLLLAGKRDTTVRPGNTLRLAAAIRAKGGFALDLLYPGIGHVEIIAAFSGPLRFLAPSLRDSASFMHAPAEAMARW
ncbi:alpha/beta hydrolase [Lichenicoccus sp.]|uniref:alpha/beta hydrolase n=1 Tax=Lichenicoccus sp. TaxID=2781899 RepID=UPI003D127EDF